MSDHPSENTLHRFARAELGDHLAAHVAEHVDGCARCANVVRLEDPFTRAFASVDEPEVPPELLARVLAAARASEPGAAEPADPPSAAAAQRPPRAAAPIWAGAWMLAAAVVLSVGEAALSVGGAEGGPASLVVVLAERLLTLRRVLHFVAPDDLSALSIAMSCLMLVGALWLSLRGRFTEADDVVLLGEA